MACVSSQQIQPVCPFSNMKLACVSSQQHCKDCSPDLWLQGLEGPIRVLHVCVCDRQRHTFNIFPIPLDLRSLDLVEGLEFPSMLPALHWCNNHLCDKWDWMIGLGGVRPINWDVCAFLSMALLRWLTVCRHPAKCFEKQKCNFYTYYSKYT